MFVTSDPSPTVRVWPDAPAKRPVPDTEAALPYEYWRVKDEMTPFFHRLPTFNPPLGQLQHP